MLKISTFSHCILPVIVGSLAIPLPVRAQTLKQDPAALALLDKARDSADVQRVAPASFHLEANFQTFDYQGKPDGDGTVVETFLKGGEWVRLVTFRGKHEITLFSGGKIRRESDDDFEDSFVEERIVRSLLDPVPDAAALQRNSLEMKKVKLGTVELLCVVAGLPYSNERDSQATAPNNAYCMDDGGLLRVVEGHNRSRMVFNGVHKIGPAHFNFDIGLSEGGVKRASLHVDKLVPMTDDDAKRVIAAQDVPGKELRDPEVADKTVIAGRRISATPPIYPQDAKDRHISGSVVLHCIIGRNGRIRDMELVSAPDDSLVPSAMEAVRTWRYQPYMMGGQPTDVDTTITVNYAFTR